MNEEMACEQAHKLNERKRAGTRFPAPAQFPRRESRVASQKGPAPTAFLFRTRAECVAVDVTALATGQDTHKK